MTSVGSQPECTQCGALIPPAAVNVDLRLARCTHCGHAFALDDAAVLMAVPNPGGADIREDQHCLVISVAWPLITTTTVATPGALAAFVPRILISTYVFIAGFFNKTTVTLRGDSIEVRHGPFPWPGLVESVPPGSDFVTSVYAESGNCRVLLRSPSGGTMPVVLSARPTLARYLEYRLIQWRRKSMPGTTASVDAA